VKGVFIVRQKRIPTIIGQGLSIGIDSTSHIPMLYDTDKKKYISEGFLSENLLLLDTYQSRELTSDKRQSSGLLCMDACVSPIMQSMLDGTDFVLQKMQYSGDLYKNDRHFNIDFVGKEILSDHFYKAQMVFVNSDVPAKVINDTTFCTRAGAEEDVKQFGFFGEKNYDKTSNKYVRGVYCPFIGTTSILDDNTIYNIRPKGYSEGYLKEYFKLRGGDNSPFYAISDRYELDDVKSIDVYRGDCYTNTVTFRINRNFIDSEVPVNDLIIDAKT